MNTARRFKDQGIHLPKFWDRILVVSPDGSGPAIVNGEASWTLRNATLCSLNSTFRLQFPSDKWYGPVIGSIDAFCPACSKQVAKQLIIRENLSTTTKSQVTWRCGCGHDVSRPIKWRKLQFTNRAIDPYFGLPLWLQIEVAGEVLWAYNRNHLDYLESYIAATIRESGSAPHRSIVSRLPTWMKIAPNRPKILRAIERLRKKIV